MELTDALSWLVGMSAALGIVVNARQFGRQAYGWLLVNAALLGLVVLGEAAKAPFFTFVATGGWALFVVGAGAVRRRQVELIGQLRFDAAARWARLGAWLHPFHGARDSATYFLALGDAIGGRFAEARARFSELEKSPELGELARVELLRLDGDWAGIVALVESRRAARPKLALTVPYLRSLGELGEVSRLLAAFASLPPPVQRLAAARLTVVAFAGRADLVRALFATELASDPGPLQSYWLGIAEQAKGDVLEAKERLERMVKDGVLVAQVEQRLLRPAPVARPESLEPAAQRTLAELGRDIEEARALPGVGAPPRRPIATLGLMVVLSLVFVAGALASGSDIERAIRFGALVLPTERVGGAAWRVVSAGFVHANGTHLAMNLLGLLVLGRLVERSWGPLPMLISFLGSSIGAFTIGLFFMDVSSGQQKVLLGASAGVLGLVGSMASFAATGYFLGGVQRLRRWLRSAALIVGVQLLFDAYHPVVSSFLHLAGIGSGAVLALPFALHTFGNKKAARRPSNAA